MIETILTCPLPYSSLVSEDIEPPVLGRVCVTGQRFRDPGGWVRVKGDTNKSENGHMDGGGGRFDLERPPYSREIG